MGIARVVGNPIKVDDRSLDGSVGNYIRVLVEVDLAMPIHMEVMVNGPDYCDLVHLQFENLPSYCPNCKLVGHSVTNCYKLKRKDGEQYTQSNWSENKTTSKSPTRGIGRGGQGSRLIHREVDKSKDHNAHKEPSPSLAPSEVITNNTFSALAELDDIPDALNGSEVIRQASVEKVNVSVDDVTPHNFQQSNEISHPKQTKSMAFSSALIPFVQKAPKSILKKPRREVTVTRSEDFNSLPELERKNELAQRITETRASDPRVATQSWADLADEVHDIQLNDDQTLSTTQEKTRAETSDHS